MFRGILDNVLSGMKAGFKAILNLEHPFARRKMDTQKSSSKLSATLLALILGASVFMAGQVWAAKYVTDPTTGKTVSAPEYGGTLTMSKSGGFPPTADPYFSTSWALHSLLHGVLESLSIGNWAIDRDEFDWSSYADPLFGKRGALAESWEQPDPLTYIMHIRQGVYWHDKPPVHGR